jgi:hypothetical protein
MLAEYFLGLFFDPEDGGNVFLRNIYEILSDCTASLPVT